MEPVNFVTVLEDLELHAHQADVEEVERGHVGAIRLQAREGDWLVDSIYLPHTSVSAVRRALANPVLERSQTLLLSDYIGERTASTLRRDGIQFLDRAGNAFLSLPGLRVDVRGRRRSPAAGAPLTTEGNLFSRRRAQVVFVLLAWPELTAAPIRVIADSAGVSVGLAQQTMQLLTERSYIAGRGSDTWLDHSTLQQQWVTTYPETLQRYLPRAAYAGHLEALTLVDADGPIAISGEYAAQDLLNPSSLTLYSTSDLKQTIRTNRWRTDAEPNIFVRTHFWTNPHGTDSPIAEAPPLLVYADLLSSDDPRQRSVAPMYWERHAPPR